MKFSIREIMLVTVIVALATGWWVDHLRLRKEIDQMFPKSIPLNLNGIPTPALDPQFRRTGDGRKP
ncbi:MAG: hypothetical protein K8R36_20610 [Planctomycetales bacterium]|nr:hypothetical protein [Planctomycetales bacterium]